VVAAPREYGGPRAYLTGRVSLHSGGSQETVVVFHDYGGWRNEFVYNDVDSFLSGVADGARTTDTSGRLLAQARLCRRMPNEGVEVEEYHYGKGGTSAFFCKSVFGFGAGAKRSERDRQGRREAEYYFIWPTSTMF